MKICIPVVSKSMSSMLSPSFGRAPFFLFIDLENSQHEFVQNPAINFPRGAGISAAQLVVERGASAVLTQNIGPRAYEVLVNYGVKVYGVVASNAQEALEKFKRNEVFELTPRGGFGRGGFGWRWGSGMRRGLPP